jgi:hypothetical protein
VSGGAIKVGAGVHHVKVSANIAYSSLQSSGNRHARIKKNDTTVAWVSTYGPDGYNVALVFTDNVVSVEEGDLLTLCYYGTTVDDVVYAGSSANGRQTYMTVEVVD